MAQPPKSGDVSSDPTSRGSISQVADTDAPSSSPTDRQGASPAPATPPDATSEATAASEFTPEEQPAGSSDPETSPTEASGPAAATDAEGPTSPENSVRAASSIDTEDGDEMPVLPESFDALALPDTLRSAIEAMGWTRPTPVQVLSFDPVVQGRDVLVQSQTGTGKTGAFCLPWLAARFEDAPASQTGVQLLVLTPTRELAKQVCDQLVQLGADSNVTPLPVYGGTAMQPQLQALKQGVHAVVGTPGRILDHIRRRSLNLSKVQMVVLDEADEMLSMGFLEDIHAILDACPKEQRQTTLFSATVPPDIERIARRYMDNPIPIKLSGDQVASIDVEHTYYTVGGSIRTRDIVDVIAQEEPATGLIFCNTREETNVVASVLRREGYAAEALSSDLTQKARERVLQSMRSGRLRFLVATDVASRGIDISHISHVINYTFPENAESYIHRTGRTGRAGRAGVAISLISPRELGNFYYLKLQYPTLEFAERNLPPAEELEAQRSERQLDRVAKLFPDLVSPEWTLLARNLMRDPRGEHVVAYLLSEAVTAAEAKQQSVSPLSEEDEEERAAEIRDDENRRGRGRYSERDRDGDPRDRRRRRGRSDARDESEQDLRSRGRPRGRRRDESEDESLGHRRSRRRVDDADASPRRVALDVEAERHEPARARHTSEAPESGSEDAAPAVVSELGHEASSAEAGSRDIRAGTQADYTAEADSAEPDPAEPGADRGSDDQESPAGRRRRRNRRRRGQRDERDETTARATSSDESDSDDASTEDERFSRSDRGRRRGRLDPATLLTDGLQPPAALEPEGLGERPEASEDEGGTARATADEVVAAPADELTEQEPDDGAYIGGRRRRRRRRRRKGGSGEERDARESQESPESTNEDGQSSTRATPSAEADDDERGDGRRRKRRRRRRRRGSGGGATERPEIPVAQHVSQDQIVIDIDESELEVVRDEFGEIDELDDLTLKGRRRGVIDALQDEVELEDLSETDSRAATDEDDDDDDDDDDTSGDDDTEAADSTDQEPKEVGVDDQAIAADDADDEDDDKAKAKAKNRRKRRRRRKKKTEEVPTPALTAPPHKDFWEVWATHFNYEEFEDQVFLKKAGIEPEPEEPEVEERPAAASTPMESREPDEELATIRLNVGRRHGKKAADIRGLLADRCSLAGKAIKNLTVGDASTRFRVGVSKVQLLESKLQSFELDEQVSLMITVVESSSAAEAAIVGEVPPPSIARLDESGSAGASAKPETNSETRSETGSESTTETAAAAVSTRRASAKDDGSTNSTGPDGPDPTTSGDSGAPSQTEDASSDTQGAAVPSTEPTETVSPS